MSPVLKMEIHSALKTLAERCDGAHERDDVGFNASHAYAGRLLANVPTLLDNEAMEGLMIIKHYRRQLGGDRMDRIEALEFEDSLESGSSPPPAPLGSQGSVTPPPPRLPEIQLTQEQTQAAELIMSFMEDDPRDLFKLGGYAGTGKTTLIKYIIKELSKKYSIATMAFTGKAVNVLQKKGIQATTIHSRCYDVIEDPKTHEVTFERKLQMIDDPDLVIVDEASMISRELYETLLSYGKKYLFVGDPGQLEPVGDNPNLMKQPNFVLSKIHRQAEQSPIIAFANVIRQGGPPVYQSRDGLIVRRKELSSPEFLSCDQVICAKNLTRKSFNEKIRRYLKYPLRDIVEGDKLICLRNNTSFGVFNGMIFKVEKITDCNGFRWKTECRDELNKLWYLPIWCNPFRDSTFDEKKVFVPKEVVYCDYGYAITCHKSQGSEWGKVLVWDEWFPPHIWDMKRWRYTAITRASKELIFNI